MKKGVLSGLGRAASKRVKNLQATVSQTADEFLEKTYVGTAEQTLHGAATVTAILHEKGGDIAKAKSSIANKAKTKKKPKRNISKRSAQRVVKRKSRTR